jgi:hypothetical protein
VVDTLGGETNVTIPAVVGVNRIRAKRVYTTSTATGLVALW